MKDNKNRRACLKLRCCLVEIIVKAIVYDFGGAITYLALEGEFGFDIDWGGRRFCYIQASC